MNFNVATNSLDQCIATLANLITMNTYLNSQITNDESVAGVGDGFNQSYYFMRAGIDLLTSLLYFLNIAFLNSSIASFLVPL